MSKVTEIRAALTNNPEKINHELLVQCLEELERGLISIEFARQTKNEAVDQRLSRLEREEMDTASLLVEHEKRLAALWTVEALLARATRPHD